MTETVMLLSVRELRNMDRGALEVHKANICMALWDAPTELDKEPYREQLHRINTIINEKPQQRGTYNIGL